MAENTGTQKTQANLAVIGPMSLEGGLVPRTLDEAMNVAKILAESLLIPAHLRGKPADVLVTMLKGLELGLKPMHAFAEIFVVEGRPGCSAALKRALVLQSPLCEYFRCVESTDKKATYVSKRKGSEHETRTTYTIEQATAAGLAGRNTWKAHPAAMLRARASSGEADANWSDVTQGMASLDELKEIEVRGETVKVNPLPRTVAPPTPTPPPPTPPSTVPDEPVENDTSWLDPEPQKAEEKPVEQPPAESKPPEMSETDKIVALIDGASDVKHLEVLVERIKKLPKEEQLKVKKPYSDKRTALSGARSA